jgi:hypothetical protein
VGRRGGCGPGGAGVFGLRLYACVLDAGDGSIDNCEAAARKELRSEAPETEALSGNGAVTIWGYRDRPNLGASNAITAGYPTGRTLPGFGA